MGDTFFTSDTHFCHTNIIGYDARPFDSVEAHDEGLIERWNEVVKPGDTVYHLGDFAFAKDAATVTYIVKRLNGQKHLMFGNHDRDAVLKSEGWASMREPYRELKFKMGGKTRQKIVLSHYPLLTWNGAHKDPGAWMLHGHCHKSLKQWAPDENGMAVEVENTRLDVGVMCWDYAPVSLDTIAATMSGRTYVVVDQHQKRVRPCSKCDGKGNQRTVTRDIAEPPRPEGDRWLPDGPEESKQGHNSRRWWRECQWCDGTGQK